LGILKKPPRTQSGYRVYPPESLDRVLLIRNALASGFTLKELASILRVRDAGGVPCRQVSKLAHEKVEQLDAQIAQLTRLRDSLMRTAQEWDRRMEGTLPGVRANLLESLSTEKGKQANNPRGDANEVTADCRVTGDSGFGLRSKRNHVPHARAASGGR
jgi:DNA-binding transcriptional MerR regulator